MRWIGALLLVLVLMLAGCGTGQSIDEAYQETYDTYAKKMQEATPTLIADFQSEADGEEDVIRLAELCDEKIAELALISTEGMQKMAEIQVEYNGAYSEYEEWAGRLMQVYTDEAAKITAVYMEQGAST